MQTYKLNDASNHDIGTEDLNFPDIDSFLMMGSVSTGSQTQVQVIPLKIQNGAVSPFIDRCWQVFHRPHKSGKLQKKHAMKCYFLEISIYTFAQGVLWHTTKVLASYENCIKPETNYLEKKNKSFDSQIIFFIFCFSFQ